MCFYLLDTVLYYKRHTLREGGEEGEGGGEGEGGRKGGREGGEGKEREKRGKRCWGQENT